MQVQLMVSAFILSVRLFLQGSRSSGTKGTAMLTTICPNYVASCKILMDGSAAEISQYLMVLEEHKA